MHNVKSMEVGERLSGRPGGLIKHINAITCVRFDILSEQGWNNYTFLTRTDLHLSFTYIWVSLDVRIYNVTERLVAYLNLVIVLHIAI